MILYGDVKAKLTEIRDKRTHCQCSRAKVVEKIYFDRVIEEISHFGMVFDRKTAMNTLSEQADAIIERNEDFRIQKIVWKYAIEVIRRADDVQIEE